MPEKAPAAAERQRVSHVSYPGVRHVITRSSLFESPIIKGDSGCRAVSTGFVDRLAAGVKRGELQPVRQPLFDFYSPGMESVVAIVTIVVNRAELRIGFEVLCRSADPIQIGKG